MLKWVGFLSDLALKPRNEPFFVVFRPFCWENRRFRPKTPLVVVVPFYESTAGPSVKTEKIAKIPRKIYLLRDPHHLMTFLKQSFFATSRKSGFWTILDPGPPWGGPGRPPLIPK